MMLQIRPLRIATVFSGIVYRVVICLLLITWMITLVACAPVAGPLYSDSQKVSDSYAEMGFAYLLQGNRERAKRSLVKALSIDPRSQTALHGMALVYRSEGEDTLAEQYFLQALDRDRHFSAARNNFAAFLYEKGRYNEACKQLKLTVSDTLYRKRWQAFENLGLCLLKIDQPHQAEDAFLKALRLNARSPIALLEMADRRHSQKQPLAAWLFLQEYMSVAKMTSRSLRLGIELADVLNMYDERRHLREELARLKQ
ncbi:type IV pilus biogenesis/stability protein PilW [Oceanospirillum sediminis]|uniref:Type IV pilus biogenesis/stability protein PilW n=1 Tax=Oceanospirillum sediminis TaxID=2760088 RepID=A0A839IK77_9GAMM|nr:type IV pilus biogenesis/stability protein PilW [Oceanospirillum sediminis]MBB1485585.1 type IV pilus biogenesis/stability protein PilW [Oceanospirillum sediminis]